MSTIEAEHVLKHLAQVKNVSDHGELVTPAVNLLRLRERQERQREIEQIDEVLHAPAWAKAGLDGDAIKHLPKRQRDLKKQLEALSPQEVSGSTLDAVARRAEELAEQIRIGMPTLEEMRRNPVGAVGKHTRWAKANRLKIPEWKNLRIQLAPDSDDPDEANVEQIRPSMMNQDGSSTFMSNAQIPGRFAMSPLAKEHWPLGEPTATTATSHLRPVCDRCGASVPLERRYCQPCLHRLIDELESLKAELEAPPGSEPEHGRPTAPVVNEPDEPLAAPPTHRVPRCKTCRRFLPKSGVCKPCQQEAEEMAELSRKVAAMEQEAS